MNGADYLLVSILLISVFGGIIRGFIRESIVLLSWLVGVWIAWHYGQVLDPYLGGVLSTPVLREWAGRIILLVLVVFVGAALAALVAHLTHRAVGLAATDRLLGALFGLIRAVVIIGTFVMVGRGLELDGEDWWQQSSTMRFAEHAGNWLDRYAEPVLEEATELMRR